MWVHADTDISQPARARVSAALHRVGRSIWPIGDQILISGANFTVHVLAARMLGVDQFGVFSVVFGALMFATIFQSALISRPHNVIGATRTGEDYRRYTTASCLGQILICAAELLIAVPLALLAYHQGWPAAPVLLALIPMIVFWQLQEWVRGVLYTEERHRPALLYDVVTYGGAAVTVAALYAAHLTWEVRVSGAHILVVLASTSAVSAGIGIYELRAKFTPRFSFGALKENWAFGKWLAASEILVWCSSMHMQIWWAALLIGAAQSADLRAADILLGPTRVIAFYLATVLPIQFVRRLHLQGTEALHARLRLAYSFVIPVTGLYCLVLAAFPGPLLRAVYGQQYSSGDAENLLTICALAAFLRYLQIVLSAALIASGRTQQIFFAQVWGSGVALSASPVLILAFGNPGAVLSVILSTCVSGLLLLRAYRNIRLATPARPTGAPDSLLRNHGATAP